MENYTLMPTPITAEEAQRIADKQCFLSAGLLFHEICEAMARAYPNYTEETNIYLSLAALYVAGRVDGIREERAKRRRKGQNGPQTTQTL